MKSKSTNYAWEIFKLLVPGMLAAFPALLVLWLSNRNAHDMQRETQNHNERMLDLQQEETRRQKHVDQERNMYVRLLELYGQKNRLDERRHHLASMGESRIQSESAYLLERERDVDREIVQAMSVAPLFISDKAYVILLQLFNSEMNIPEHDKRLDFYVDEIDEFRDEAIRHLGLPARR